MVSTTSLERRLDKTNDLLERIAEELEAIKDLKEQQMWS